MTSTIVSPICKSLFSFVPDESLEDDLKLRRLVDLIYERRRLRPRKDKEPALSFLA